MLLKKGVGLSWYHVSRQVSSTCFITWDRYLDALISGFVQDCSKVCVCVYLVAEVGADF